MQGDRPFHQSHLCHRRSPLTGSGTRIRTSQGRYSADRHHQRPQSSHHPVPHTTALTPSWPASEESEAPEGRGSLGPGSGPRAGVPAAPGFPDAWPPGSMARPRLRSSQFCFLPPGAEAVKRKQRLPPSQAPRWDCVLGGRDTSGPKRQLVICHRTTDSSAC